MSRLDKLLNYHRDDPADSFVRYALAQEYLRLGETNKALEYFEGLIVDDPDYVGTYYHLGKLYESLRRKDDAIRTYRDGIEVAKQASDPHTRAELQSALLEAQGIGFDHL